MVQTKLFSDLHLAKFLNFLKLLSV